MQAAIMHLMPPPSPTFNFENQTQPTQDPYHIQSATGMEIFGANGYYRAHLAQVVARHFAARRPLPYAWVNTYPTQRWTTSRSGSRTAGQ